MRHLATSFVLPLGLAILSGSAGYAQDKAACELLSKADAQAVLGVTLQPPKPFAPFRSLLENQDFINGKPGEGCNFTSYTPNQPRQQKVAAFSLEVRYSQTPNPNAVDEARKQVNLRTRDNPTDLADLGDAAFWIGPSNNVTLFVFRGGTMRLMIGPSEIGLEQEKALAVKSLAALGRTGYVYGARPSGLSKQVLSTNGQVLTQAQSPATAASGKPTPGGKPPVPPATASAVAAKAAAPSPAATNGLVRKSKAYWEGYRSEIVRQVFDGGFGSDVDLDTQFRILFTTYVESFSKSCPTYLPARHEAVTVTQITRNTDPSTHTFTRQEGKSTTVQVDSRFAPKYRQFTATLGSSGQNLGTAVGIMAGRVSASAYLDPGFDAIKFFKTEACQSAAMRQLGENLLLGATGKPSLQDVGATIAGASAETDKSLPPGRFAHFVDGCNAFYRDPKNSRYSMSDATGWCKCLSEQYRNVMTSEEESKYANDFERLFHGGIAQPLGSGLSKSDPAWPRLHPAVEKCVR